MNKRKCPCCGLTKVGPIRVWRCNTMYADDRLNYQTSCYRCILENDHMRHWDWAEYYSSVHGYYVRDEYKPRSPKEYVRKDLPNRYIVCNDDYQVGRVYVHRECASNYARMMTSLTNEQHWIESVHW